MRKERTNEEKIEFIVYHCGRMGINVNVERFKTKEDYIEKYGLDKYLKLIK